ncbi:MAG: hypothetical protein WCI71_12805, partial [Bacteroidota bacterium]
MQSANAARRIPADRLDEHNNFQMKQPFDPRRNHAETQQKTGYVPRKNATQADYDRIGFMSGL